MTPEDGQMIAEAIVDEVAIALKIALAPVLARLAAVEARQPLAGPPGPQGERGERGQDGAAGVKGLDGAPGLPGDRGDPGPQGERGADGRDGRDGLAGKDGQNGRAGDMGATGPAGANGLDGAPGRDGQDGLGLEDFSVVYDGERRLSLVLSRGELIKASALTLPIVLYRGVFEEGRTYALNDAVTWGGSLWIARDATTEKPGTSKAWQLAVKQGRDGREGKAGPGGPAGPKGDKGDPGRHGY